MDVVLGGALHSTLRVAEKPFFLRELRLRRLELRLIVAVGLLRLPKFINC
jgi:hypothetical protein